jgi:hypothetical protein
MTSPQALEPRRHAPPPGWSPDVFERLTGAIAAALVAAARRQAAEPEEAAQSKDESR